MVWIEKGVGLNDDSAGAGGKERIRLGGGGRFGSDGNECGGAANAGADEGVVRDGAECQSGRWADRKARTI